MGAANCFGAPMSWTLAPDVGFIGCFVLIIGERPPPATVSLSPAHQGDCTQELPRAAEHGDYFGESLLNVSQMCFILTDAWKSSSK